MRKIKKKLHNVDGDLDSSRRHCAQRSSPPLALSPPSHTRSVLPPPAQPSLHRRLIHKAEPLAQTSVLILLGAVEWITPNAIDFVGGVESEEGKVSAVPSEHSEEGEVVSVLSGAY